MSLKMRFNTNHIRFLCIYTNNLQNLSTRNAKVNELMNWHGLYNRIMIGTELGHPVAKRGFQRLSNFPIENEVKFNYKKASNRSRLSALCRTAPEHQCYNRHFSSHAQYQCKQKRKEESQDLVESLEQDKSQITVGQKVKQAGKDASYMGVLIIGFGVTGVLIWYVVSELLFSFSPNSVYTKALKVVKANDLVADAVGTPMKAYGEETSRGRRRHVSHQEYVVNGNNFMRVKFYVSGAKRKGTVHVDTKETSRGKFEFRYIFVELDGYPAETIVVLDNR